MILLMSSIALAELCPTSDTAEFISWARPALFEWGEWSHQDGTLQLERPEAQGRWSVWIPQQQATADARYRLRLKPGSQANMTLLARATLDPNGTDELSGYGLGLEKNKLILYRWDKGEVRALMPPVVLEPQKEIELLFELSGDLLTAYACHPQDNTQLAYIEAIDSAHSTGFW